MKLNLPAQDSSTGRALKTFVQTVVGFLFGLIVVVWAVPGVPHAVVSYVETNLVQVLLLAGAPAGAASFVWNLFRSDVPNY